MMTTGCSMVGLGVGASIDARRPKQKSLPAEGLDLVKPGTKLIIIMNDSTEKKGEFMGMDRFSSLEYNQRYSNCRKKLESDRMLPVPGEKLTLCAASSNVSGNLVAFDQKFEGSGKITTVKMNIPGQGNEMVSKLDEIEQLETCRGDTLQSGDLSLLVRQGRLPSVSTIALQQQYSPEFIPIDRVSAVWLENECHAAETGFLIGLGIDVIVVTVIMLTLRDYGVTRELTF
jgi:hypothetical protein